MSISSIFPPLEGAAKENDSEDEVVGKDSFAANVKRVRIARAGKTPEREVYPPSRLVNIGPVVHPFRVTSGLVDSEEVHRDISCTSTSDKATSALLPQDLCSSTAEDAILRRKSTLQVSKPQCLKSAIYPRKHVEKPPVYRIPSSEDLSKGYERKKWSKGKKKKVELINKDLIPKMLDSSDLSKKETTTLATESVKKFREETDFKLTEVCNSKQHRPSFFGGDSVRPTSSVITHVRYTQKELRAKFKYAIRMVCLVVGLNSALKNLQTKKGDAQSIEQLNYYSAESEFAVEKMVFRKALFAASNIMFVPQWARDLLSQQPEERSGREVTRLASMLKTLRYFKSDLQFEKLEDLCRHATFALYEKQRTIMRTGHSPMFAYLLMSGSVFLNIELKSQDDEKKKFVKTAAVLQKGSLFGEIAVIHNIKRTASIVSRENVECLVIDTDTCMRIFPDAINRDFENRLHHLKQSGLFTDWPHNALRDLCLVSKKVDHTYGDVVEKNTASSEFIYMVTKGRIEVMYQARFTADAAPPSKTSDVVSISKLVAKPPNHMFLPPLPHPCSSLLCPTPSLTTPGVKETYMSMDSLYCYDCCDMLSLVKNKEPLPLILVSRGSEVIRIPKLCLQTIPPNHYWKALLEKAKTYLMYPSADVLMQIFLEHCQWKSYRQLVFKDLMSSSGNFVHLPRHSDESKSPKKNKARGPRLRKSGVRGLKSEGASSGTVGTSQNGAATTSTAPRERSQHVENRGGGRKKKTQ